MMRRRRSLEAREDEKSIICMSWKYLPQRDGRDGDASFGGRDWERE